MHRSRTLRESWIESNMSRAPNLDLHYVSSHGAACPRTSIPASSRLVISGMVEAAGWRCSRWTTSCACRPFHPTPRTCECARQQAQPLTGRPSEQMHGMVGCSEWTGVPLAALLDARGRGSGGELSVFDGRGPNRSGSARAFHWARPWTVVIVAYGHERGAGADPHQGYPLRRRGAPAFKASTTSSG